ncbi:YlbG family protein [Sporolactobacillus putidus]|uniref:UPF0298 protein n=1 Tax=Sporolactobacillus putidus TaxID=492735 RepID=A0A917RYB8_9BACL|nr:YlbG family protein [Sporolactobacillus putidus]GGL44914.1 UPF0298 protein [Sporolactobacillus putidus]
MPFQKRDGLVVWLYNLKYLRVLRRYGYVHYVSKKMKYAILYCNGETTEFVVSQLARMKFVKSIEQSHLQEVRTTYEKGKTKREEKDEIYNY